MLIGKQHVGHHDRIARDEVDHTGRKARLLEQLEHVGSVRYRGLMGGVEVVKDKTTKEPYPFEERIGYQIILEARKQGVILRPLGDVIVLMPPLAVSLEELDILFAATEKAIRKVTD